MKKITGIFLMSALLGISVPSYSYQSSPEAHPDQGKMFAGQTEKYGIYVWQLRLAGDGQDDHSSELQASYCFYRSQLTKIINQAYLEQKNPHKFTCDGLTTEQLSTIDFNRIDFSEYLLN